MIRRFGFGVLLFAAASLFAQVPEEALPLSEPPSMYLPGSEPQATVETAAKERELKVFATPPGNVATMAVTSSGANGELWLDPPPSPFGTGVLLRALTNTPNVFTQLGTTGSDSAFSVSNSAGSIPFRVRGDGTTLFGWGIPYWMRVYPNGNVALQAYGDTPYAARLMVQHGTDNSTAVFASHQPNFEVGNPAQNDYGVYSQTHLIPAAGANNPGSINGLYTTTWLTGPGTLSAAFGAVLDVGTSTYSGGDLAATLSYAIGLDVRLKRAAASTVTNGYGVRILDVPATADYGIYQMGADDDNYFAGRIGIGTAQPADLLHVNAAANPVVRLSHTDPTSATNAVMFYEGTSLYGFINQRGSSHATQPRQFNIGNNNASGNTGLWAGGSSRMVIYSNGNVGIGTTSAPAEKLYVSGNVRASGSIIADGGVIGATYQDLAEWVPATSDMEPGTVVVLNVDRINEVMPSQRAYDTSVAGVVSAQPGILLGVAGDTKEQIATTGRVRVSVDATRGAIRVGDLLVTSEIPGTAMKSTPIDVGGVAMHRPGTIIGKALEPLESGRGEILVLLSLQ